MDKFPHLTDTKFPGVSNIDTYAYQNNFDYDRWQSNVKVKLCNVPWENDGSIAVKFEDDNERDTYLDNLNGLTLETVFYKLITNQFDIPLPFDSAYKYNYLVVDYTLRTSDTEMIDYETTDSINRLCYFITDLAYGAPNCTQCTLQLDWWSTFINHVNFNYSYLKRGHVGLKTSVNEYLDNPIENNKYLLADDVVFSDNLSVVSHTNNIVLNDDNYVFFAMKSDFSNKENNYTSIVNGVGSYEIIYIDINDFDKFVKGMIDEKPKLVRNIKAIWFAPKKLTEEYSSITQFGVRVHYPRYNTKQIPLLKLNKDMFGYDDKYKDLAKLYTSPYAALEITDSNGNVEQINIEDTTGSLDIYTCLNVAYPYLSVNTKLLGVGGVTVQNIDYKTTITRNTKVQGTWYKFVRDYEIPTFNIKVNNTVIDKLDNEGFRDSRLNSAKVTRDNTIRSADTNKTNSSNMNKTNTTNITNGANTTRENIRLRDNLAYALREQNKLELQAKLDESKTLADALVDNSNEKSVAQNTVNVETSLGAAAGAAIASGVGMAIGAVSPAIGGMALAGAALTAPFHWAGSQANLNIALNATSKQNTAQKQYNENICNITNDFYKDNQILSSGNIDEQDINTLNTNKNNSIRSSNTINDNLQRSGNTSIQNAKDVYSTMPYTINNERKTATLQAVHEYGEVTGSYANACEPMLYSVNVITQPKNAIEQTGDYFLRYGYAINQQYKISDLNIMNHFTYWEFDEVMLNGSGLIEGASDRIKAMLETGVTVFRTPNDIGNVSIYDNELHN